MRRRKGISEKAQISVRRGGREIQFPLDPSRATTGSMLAGIRALVDNGCSPCTIAAMYTSGPVYTYKYGRGLHAACPLWIPWAYNFHAHTASSLENTTVKMPPSRQQRRIHIPLGMRMDTQYVAWFLLDRESFISFPRLLYIWRRLALVISFRGVHVCCFGGSVVEEVKKFSFFSFDEWRRFFRLRNNN